MSGEVIELLPRSKVMKHRYTSRLKRKSRLASGATKESESSHMEQLSDHDGRSTTASPGGGDHKHPEIRHHYNGQPPSHGDIAQRAQALWIQRGCPSDSAERDWLEAENLLLFADKTFPRLDNNARVGATLI